MRWKKLFPEGFIGYSVTVAIGTTTETLIWECSERNWPLGPRALKQGDQEGILCHGLLDLGFSACLCLCSFSVPLPHPTPTFQPRVGGGQYTQSPLCKGWYVSPPPLHPEYTMPLLLHAPCHPLHHLSTAHARLQLVTGSGQPPHAGDPGDFKQVPENTTQFLVPCSLHLTDTLGLCPYPSYGCRGSLLQPQPFPGHPALLFFG